MKGTVLGALVAALLGCTVLVAHLWLIDGLDGWLLGLGLNEDTVYASGYSDTGFRAVRRGMTVEEVHELLGPPLQTWPTVGSDVDVGERWSRSPHSTNYRCRVILYKAGRVMQKHAEFYVD